MPKLVLDAAGKAGLTWGSLSQGTGAVERSFAVQNQGPGALQVSSITVSGTSLVKVVTTTPFTVAPNGSQTVRVALTPSTVGKVTGRLVLASNDPSQGRMTIPLTADIQAAKVPKLATSLDPARTLSWGSLTAGSAAVEKSFTVTNQGASNLQVSSITVEGTALISLTSRPRFSLAPGGSQTVRVSLNPAQAGRLSARLVIPSNDPAQTRVTIALSADIKAAAAKQTAEAAATRGAALLAAFPNPFNATTTVEYRAPEEGEVRLSVYALSGQLVRELALGWHAAGGYTVSWNGRDRDGLAVGTGLYLVVLEQRACRQAAKLVLLK
jgi:hypothetical protein